MSNSSSKQNVQQSNNWSWGGLGVLEKYSHCQIAQELKLRARAKREIVP